MRKVILALVLGISSFTFSKAQVIMERDEEILDYVHQISAGNLKAHVYKLVSFGSRHTLSDQQNTSFGIGAARNWVLSQFNEFAKNANGRLTATIDTITLPADGRRVTVPTLLGNVRATLKGTDPSDKRIFLMIGHLDSRATDVMDNTSLAPGANDDASGVAGLIEACRVLSKSQFPATIMFVAVSGEEQGLLGAQFLANTAKKQGWQIEGVLNNDMIGANNANETNVINNTQTRVFSEAFPLNATTAEINRIRQLGLENDGSARQLARYFKEIGERYVDNMEVKLMYRNDRFLRGGDHSPFVELRFPAVRVTDMHENYDRQHQNLRIENEIEYGDVANHLDYEYLRKNTALNVATLSNLAKAPVAPADVVYDMKGLENSTTIVWKAGDNRTRGFYVLMRETNSAIWQKKFFTKETSFKLPYSKDNYFFAVQAVSESGNESVPVIVVPANNR